MCKSASATSRRTWPRARTACRTELGTSLFFSARQKAGPGGGHGRGQRALSDLWGWRHPRGRCAASVGIVAASAQILPFSRNFIFGKGTISGDMNWFWVAAMLVGAAVPLAVAAVFAAAGYFIDYYSV